MSINYKSLAEQLVVKRLITKVYPSGIVSLVSDTFDFWNLMSVILPKLKDDILARDGRTVLRPDTGFPVDIICGEDVKPFNSFEDAERFFYKNVDGKCLFSVDGVVYKVKSHFGSTFKAESVSLSPAEKGAYQLLWETFGGTINDKGYKELNVKVGLIYGDSITLERQNLILKKLEAKGFSASNLVLGIGSFTYEYVTRDTFGGAMKATWGVVNGEDREIFKDPKTDSGMKKSAKGLLKVYKDEFGILKLKEQCTKEEENEGALQVIFEDGVLYNETTLKEVRETLLKNLY